MIGLKKATNKEDAILLNKLAREIWEEHYTAIIGAEQVEYMLTNLQSTEKIYQDIVNGMNYFLINFDGKTVGYTGFQLENDYLFLSKLYVKSTARQHGIGKKVFQQIQDIARENDLLKIQLTVNKYNDKSIAAYKKMGFVTVKEQVVDIGGGYIMDDFVMEYSLEDKTK